MNRWIVLIVLVACVGCKGQEKKQPCVSTASTDHGQRPVPVTRFVVPPPTTYHYAQVDGRKIFYRKAGDPSRPTIVLLHGYPSSSHSYRNLIPMLSPYYHVIAPDYLGSGYSEHVDPNKQRYTFDLLARYVQGLLKVLNIGKYIMYMQDFGAPVGYRMMMKEPKRIRALIVQNANAYLDGLVPKRQAFFKNANQDRSPKNLKKLYSYTGKKAVVHGQYLFDIPRPKRHIMSPDAWTHDLHFLTSPKDRQIQVQLFQDYYNNLLRYPKWQAMLRKTQPKTLIVWGKLDLKFNANGAKAYLRDLPKASLHLLDAGHFAAEEKTSTIARLILRFLHKHLS